MTTHRSEQNFTPPVRVRNRTSARKAGSSFERVLADHLAAHVDPRIDRRVKTGAKDRGDIGGVRTAHGLRVVIEAKSQRTLTLGTAYGEAETEMGNDDAQVAVLAHKRHGVGAPGRQWVTMTVDDLITLLTGERPAAS
jgi:hypothetical protein